MFSRINNILDSWFKKDCENVRIIADCNLPNDTKGSILSEHIKRSDNNQRTLILSAATLAAVVTALIYNKWDTSNERNNHTAVAALFDD